MSLCLVLLFVSILTNGVIAISCYSCDSSTEPECWNSWALYSIASPVPCQNMCFVVYSKDRQQVKRGCTEFEADAWDFFQKNGVHRCPGVPNQDDCIKCDTDLCNSADVIELSVFLLTVLSIITIYMQ